MMTMGGVISKGGRMEEKKESLIDKLMYALMKTLKYVVLVVAIALVVGFVLSLIFDFTLTTTYKVLGGVIIFGAVASQFGTGNMHRDYNYNMSKMSNDNGKFDGFSKNMSDSIVFTIIGGIGGILVFVIGTVIDRFM